MLETVIGSDSGSGIVAGRAGGGAACVTTGWWNVGVTEDPLNALAQLPGVAEEVRTVRSAVDKVYSHRVMRRRSAEVTAEAALRGARASGACAGADWALEEVRRRTDFGEDSQARTVGAALRATAEVGPMLDTWRRAPAQVLARLHLVAAGGGTPDEESAVGSTFSDAARVGRPRRAEERPDVELPGGDRRVDEVVQAPSAAEASARLEGLSTVLLSSPDAPALVVAAIVHGELAVVRPFANANGVVARAAQRLTLVARGLDPKAICPAEVGLAELGVEAGVQALQGYVSGTPDGMARWIAHCAEAMRLGVRETVAVCEAMQRGML